MPARTQKTSRTLPRKTKATSVALLGKLKGDRMKETGVSSRIAGHVSAHGKRTQAKKDAR